MDLQQACNIFTQPSATVSDVIATLGNFSSSAGKGQRRRWDVHTSEAGQRMLGVRSMNLASGESAAVFAEFNLVELQRLAAGMRWW